MPEYLEPVVTKLLGDLSDLAKTVAEAETLMKGYQDSVEKSSTESAKRTGEKSGTSLIDGLKKMLAEGRLEDYDFKLLRDIDDEFKKAGTKGGQSLYSELAKVLGPGGLDTVVGNQVTKSFSDWGLKGGIQAGDLFSKGFTSGLGDIALTAAPVLAPMAVVLASELLADIGGVIGGGAGLSLIIAGAVTQIKTNPDVQAAAKDFGSWFVAEFKDDTASLADPVRDAFAILKTDSAGPLDDLKKDFAAVAPYARDFATFIGAAEEKAMPGFNRLVQTSGPLLEELGHGLVYAADGLNVMFDEISKGGKGEVEALDMTFHLLGQTLAAIGFTIRYGADLFDGFIQTEKVVVDWMDKIFGGWTLFGPLISKSGLKAEIDGIANSFDDGGASVSGYGRKFDDLTREIDRQKAAVDALTKSWDDWFGLSMKVDEATLQYHQDLTALTDAIKQNGDHWDLNTKAGQANYAALLQAIQAAHDLRQAQIDSGTGTDQANKAYQTAVARLLDMAAKAGLSKDQIAALRAQVGNLTDSLNSLNGKVVHYTIVGTGPGQIPASQFHQGLSRGGYVEPGGIIHAAQGLVSGILPPTSPGTLVMAGEPETGGEVLAPLRGITQSRAMALAGVIGDAYGFPVGGSGGGGPLYANVTVNVDGQSFYQGVVITQALRHEVNYGSNGLSRN